jgi:hypothetical protein
MRVVDSAEELLSCGGPLQRPRKGGLAQPPAILAKGRGSAALRHRGAVPLPPPQAVPPAGAEAPEPPAPSQLEEEGKHVSDTEWGALTQRFVAFSSIPFLFLFLPQLIKNQANLSAGNTAALAVLSWLVGARSLPAARLRCSLLFVAAFNSCCSYAMHAALLAPSR